MPVGATRTAPLHLTYDPNHLPYYPVEVRVTMEHTDAAGIIRPYSRAAYVYFTPYHTVEVWD